MVAPLILAANLRKMRDILTLPATGISVAEIPARKLAAFTILEIMIVAIIVGILAALALPAFQRVRQQSQDKAVFNNARQLSNAADQYYLANGVSTAGSADLIGSLAYVKNIEIVAKEVYPIWFTQGNAITITGVAGARTVTYTP